MQEQSIFIEALEREDSAERAAFLDRACAGDVDLRRRIERLLQRHGQADGFLESPAPNLVATVDQPIRERPGTVIGPYKLLQQIGQGGMGAVYMAEQTSPVQRKVALKLIKPGMDSGQVVARFEAERQALALMDHPNIARVFDAGATEAGRPYFVMELVKGVPLTKYCDECKLTPKQRLELFVPVCQAVQHAHQKGVIHRDLKPTNVMVALYDGKPVPKVIDFGVAKAAGPKLTERTLFTGFGAVVGTLEYMSPEQAELNQLDIDTRSDIYSLGVMLYELLTGTTPLERRRLKGTGLVEALRLIREEEPPRPSARLSTTAELPAVAASRGLEPRKLSGAIRGELDWIVMKALEKDRNRRYETANGFAADVQRYLKDEPVLACPPSAGYRLGKFARRNKGRLAVAGLVLLFLVMLGSAIGWAARDRAARQALVAGRVEWILQEVEQREDEQKWPEALAAADRAEAALAGGEADDAIRRRVGEARRSLAFVAELDRIRQDRAISIEGSTFHNRMAAQDYPRAFREYGVDVEQLPAETAIAALRAQPALAAPLAAALDDWVYARLMLGERAPSWRPLVAVARGIDSDPLRDRLRAEWVRRRTPESEAESQAEVRRLAESIDVKTQSPATLQLLVRSLIQVGLPDAANQILRDGQYAHPGDFWLNFDLGLRLHDRKDHARAVRYYSVAVSIRPDSAVAHNSLANALRDQGRLDEAITCYHKAIELDPNEAGFHSNLGNALRDQGKLDEAIVECRRAIELDPKCSPAHGNLGNALYDQGKVDGAMACYRKAIELDPKDAQGHYNLGNALRYTKDLEDAIREYRAALQIDPNIAPAHYMLGLALYDTKELEGAIREYRAAIKINPKSDFHNNLGNALMNQGKADEAIAEYRMAIELDPKNAQAHSNLGAALREQGEFGKALEELRLGHDLGSKDPHWPSAASAQSVRQCERLVELDGKLPGFLDGNTTPTSADERMELAGLCSLKRLNGAAARFYEEAFVAEPALADDRDGGHRYNAACAAALAGCGSGKDADMLDEKKKARLRGQALNWLQADLALQAKQIAGGKPDIRAEVQAALSHWLEDPDLAGVRGAEALAKLPEAERQLWQKLWDDAADVLAQAQGMTTPEKKSDAK